MKPGTPDNGRYRRPDVAREFDMRHVWLVVAAQCVRF
jgi:hypothetical protein